MGKKKLMSLIACALRNMVKNLSTIISMIASSNLALDVRFDDKLAIVQTIVQVWVLMTESSGADIQRF